MLFSPPAAALSHLLNTADLEHRYRTHALPLPRDQNRHKTKYRNSRHLKIQVTEGGGGLGGGEGGVFFAVFISTATVWCVPFCLDYSVPSVYSNLQTQKEK